MELSDIIAGYEFPPPITAEFWRKMPPQIILHHLHRTIHLLVKRLRQKNIEDVLLIQLEDEMEENSCPDRATKARWRRELQRAVQAYGAYSQFFQEQQDELLRYLSPALAMMVANEW
ncbi:MAG: hypothetical protein M1824_002467 [Vezdaea acicularis]|nr:MAG: hypothetical protein M1824_002467 [Vezdaea acicularis]